MERQTGPDRYAVIGNPIAHSKSPEIHARFAAQTGQRLEYERMLAPLDGFARAVRSFMREGGRGANVTVPFKLEAHALAESLTDRAKAAGAVNTLVLDKGCIVGDNTDGVGLVADIVRNAGVSLAGKRVLLLGAGGAARGVLLPLLREHPADFVIANRTVSKATELVQRFSARVTGEPADREPQIRAAAFDGLEGKFDLIINATSSSLTSEVPPIAPSVFGRQTLAYDMMYAREATPFMVFAALQGAQARDGLGMLVEQAAESFWIWRGVRPDTTPVFAQLRAGL